LNDCVLNPVELKAYGLLLRPWEETDRHAALRGLTDPDFRRWNTPLLPVDDEHDAIRFIRDRAEGWERGTMASYAITGDGGRDSDGDGDWEGAEGGIVLGNISVSMIDFRMCSGRVGYWVLPEARGRRVASRALEAVTRWAFRDLGLHRLELGHAVGNDASCAVARRCVYAYEGLLRGAMINPAGGMRDIHLHARLATDPAPVSSGL
jgi:RimJ/RimL family protein N-acetyltransferase